jgi:hypothetical protein
MYDKETLKDVGEIFNHFKETKECMDAKSAALLTLGACILIAERESM